MCVCAGQGVVKVSYSSGEPFDLGVCACRAGQQVRSSLVAVAARFDVPADRVWLLEELADGDDLARWGVTARAVAIEARPDDFTQAGQTLLRAGLRGGGLK